MVVNLGAYATEIIRAGVEAIPKGQIEAGLALGLRPRQVFRFVVLKPALRAVFPALTSQFILLMLTSSVVSVISADEPHLGGRPILPSHTFRTFEVYFIVTVIYLAFSLASRRCSAADRIALLSSRIGAVRTPMILRIHLLTSSSSSLLAARWTLLLSLIAFWRRPRRPRRRSGSRVAPNRLARRPPPPTSSVSRARRC